MTKGHLAIYNFNKLRIIRYFVIKKNKNILFCFITKDLYYFWFIINLKTKLVCLLKI